MRIVTVLAVGALLGALPACSSKPETCPPTDGPVWKALLECQDDCKREPNERKRTTCGAMCGWTVADKLREKYPEIAGRRLLTCDVCRTYLDTGLYPKEKGLEACVKEKEERK